VTPLKVWAGRAFVGGLAPIVVFGSRFAANVVLSRLLAPEEFGTAVAISVVLGLGGLATDVALDRFVMIDGSARGLSTAHLLAVSNGIFLATILVLFAPFAAGLFGIPKFAGSFALAAIVSVIGAFGHLGVKQIQRNYDYGPDTIAQVAANVASIIGLFIAAKLLRNHYAIIVGLGVQSAVYVVLSHVLAPTSYRFNCDKEMLFRALSFGLPLTLNGIGLAMLSQLDRVLVGHWFGVKELGLYAVIFSVSVVPTSLIINVFSRPSFSFLISDEETSRRPQRYRLLLTFYSLITSLYACWMVLTLDLLIPLIFGPSFTISPTAHVLFVLIACLRLQRSAAPTCLLLASGRTKQLAALNLSAGVGLIVAFVCVTISPTLEAMLVGVAVGEFLSFIAFFTTLGSAVTRGWRVLGDLASAISAPAIMAAALAFDAVPTWRERAVLLVIAMVTVAVQLSLELYRNTEFRKVVSGLPIVRGLPSYFARGEVCPD